MKKTILNFTILLISISYAFSQSPAEWELLRQNPPIPKYINDINFVSLHQVDENVAYSCTADGKIYKTFTRGQDWELLYSNPNIIFSELSFYETFYGLVVGKDKSKPEGKNGFIVFTADAGTTWTIVDSKELPEFTSVKYGNNNFFSSCKNGLLARLPLKEYYNEKKLNLRTDWCFGSGDLRLNSVSSCENYKIAVGESGNSVEKYYYISDKFFKKWDSVRYDQSIGAVGFKKVYSNLYNISFLIDISGTKIWRTDKTGKNLTLCYDRKSQIINSITFVDSLIGFATGSNGIVIKTIDGGVTWDQSNKIAEHNFSNIDYANKTMFLTTNSLALISENRGLTWFDPTKEENNPNFSPLYKDTLKGVWFTDDNTGFFIGNQKKLLFRTFDGCNSFDTLCFKDSGNYLVKQFNSISFTDKKEGYIASDYAQAMKTEDGGRTWRDKHFTGPIDRYLNAIVYKKPLVYVAESNGRAYRFEEDDPYYTNFWIGGFLETTPLYSLDVYDTLAFAVGAGRNYLRHQNHKIVIKDVPAIFPTNYPEGFRSIKMLNDTGYIVSDYGVIYRTLDTGKTWSVHQKFDRPLYSMHYNFSNNRNIYVVGDGIILHSTDMGTTWQKESISNVNIKDLKLRSVFVSENSIYAVGVNNVILRKKIKSSIGEEKNNSLLFPNPATNSITITGLLAGNQYQIIASNGAMAIKGIAAGNEIDIRELPIGSYNVIINQAGKVESYKFIKK